MQLGLHEPVPRFPRRGAAVLHPSKYRLRIMGKADRSLSRSCNPLGDGVIAPVLALVPGFLKGLSLMAGQWFEVTLSP
jgi:hypothetical protein